MSINSKYKGSLMRASERQETSIDVPFFLFIDAVLSVLLIHFPNSTCRTGFKLSCCHVNEWFDAKQC